MRIKNITVVDDNGQEFSFTSRSVVEVGEYSPTTDPEVQGVGLPQETTPKVAKKAKKTK